MAVDEAFRQVVAVYAEELREQAGRIAELTLQLEQDPQGAGRQKAVDELFRHAHSMKGSSGALGITDIESLAHHLEEVLTPFRRGQGPLLPEVVDLVLRAMDASRKRAQGLLKDGPEGTEGIADVTSADQGIVAVLQAAPAEGSVEGPGPAQSPAPTPSAPMPGAGGEEAHAAGAESEDETIRVSLQRLMSLERRLDELRTLHSRLDQRAINTEGFANALETSLERLRSIAATNLLVASIAEPLERVLQQLQLEHRSLIDDGEYLQASADSLDDELRTMRMVPARTLFPPLQRAVRQTARRLQKDAILNVVGGEVDVERRVLEELKNALMHMVRNAVDHGIESTDKRAAAGKPTRAVIHLTMEERGGELHVTLQDDGSGIDLGAVRKKAVNMGLITQEAAEAMSRREVYELLFMPGFSTASKVTETSGRGVGLDVVREGIIRLGGRVEVQSTQGQGSTFLLVVPMSVSTSEVMLLEEHGRIYALPHASISRVVGLKPGDLKWGSGRLWYELEDEPLEVHYLSRLLGLPQGSDRREGQILAVVATATSRTGIVVDQLLGSRELVQRPLPSELHDIDVLGAGAILPNGAAILVLSPRGLVDQSNRLDEASEKQAAESGKKRRVLVADDSIATRMLLRTVLEASGYSVLTAADGDEALLLAEQVDLVVSDVRMPGLDGWGLTQKLRAQAQTEKLPVVLFSTLDSEEDRQRSTDAGASAFLTKRAFDRGQLLEVLQTLIRDKA